MNEQQSIPFTISISQKKKKKTFIHISAKKIPFIHIHISVACTPSYCIRKIITFFFFFC